MKKLTLIAIALFSIATSASAISQFGVGLEKGIQGYAGGCFTGAGICVEDEMGGVGDGTLSYDNITGDLTITVPASSSFYGELADATYDFSSDSYLPEEVANNMGLGGFSPYIPAGTYDVTENAHGDRIISLEVITD